MAEAIFTWFAGKGFGFTKVAGEDVFVHVSVLLGAVDGIIGAKVMLKIVKDEARTGDTYKATNARREADHTAIIRRAKAVKVTAISVRALEEARRRALVAQSATETLEATHDRTQWLHRTVVADKAVAVSRLKPSSMLDREPFGEGHLVTQAIELHTNFFGERDEIDKDHFRNMRRKDIEEDIGEDIEKMARRCREE